MRYTIYLNASHGLLLVSVKAEQEPMLEPDAETGMVKVGESFFRWADVLAVVEETESQHELKK